MKGLFGIVIALGLAAIVLVPLVLLLMAGATALAGLLAVPVIAPLSTGLAALAMAVLLIRATIETRRRRAEDSPDRPGRGKKAPESKD